MQRRVTCSLIVTNIYQIGSFQNPSNFKLKSEISRGKERISKLYTINILWPASWLFCTVGYLFLRRWLMSIKDFLNLKVLQRLSRRVLDYSVAILFMDLDKFLTIQSFRFLNKVWFSNIWSKKSTGIKTRILAVSWLPLLLHLFCVVLISRFIYMGFLLVFVLYNCNSLDFEYKN